MTPSRSEVWLVNLDPTVGDEIRKVRPAAVFSRDAIGVLALRVIVPITAWQAIRQAQAGERFEGWDWLVRIDPSGDNGLDKPSAADTFQVRSVSAKRFVRRIGKLTEADIGRIASGLSLVLDL